MPAVPAIIAGGATIASSLIGKSAVGKAENLQSEAGLKAANLVADATQGAKNDLISNTTAANGTLGNVYDDLNGKIDPYLGAGKQGLDMLLKAILPGGDLSQKFSFNPSDLTRDPGYQFQLQEGKKALVNSASARGSLGAGGTMKSLVSFGEGLAGTTYDKAYNRALSTFQTNRNNTLGTLGFMTNIGETALRDSIGVGENYGNQTSGNYRFLGSTLADVGTRGARDEADILTGRANAQAAGTVGQANALTGGIKGAAEAGISGWNAVTKGVSKPKIAPTGTGWSAPLTTLN